MTEHNLPDTMSLLARTPAFLDALLRGLPDALTRRNEGENTWTAFDIVGHLIHGEHTDWMPRVKMILQHGESRPFESFDRLAQERESQGKSLPSCSTSSRGCGRRISPSCGRSVCSRKTCSAADVIPRSARSRCQSCSRHGPRTI